MIWREIHSAVGFVVTPNDRNRASPHRQDRVGAFKRGSHSCDRSV
jgi:hypothetical protein